ncbi:MAG: TauD/TfdA family dioxygenase [Acidobacteriota bacterium]|nr:TauD/TfdA family dioxygenase [Acidobacteriota bacterium]
MKHPQVIDQERGFPLVIDPAAVGLTHPGHKALTSWCLDHTADLNALLQRYGALLFRGFGADNREALSSFVNKVFGEPAAYVDGNSPRTKMSEGVYTSTEFPASETITMHNELSYSQQWPRHLVFCCVTPAASGGETPLTDGHALLQALDPDLPAMFREKKVRYIRNLHGGSGFGPTWQETFETEDRAAVDAWLAQGDAEAVWQEDGSLRISQVREAVVEHPETGHEVWFNQADQFHPSQLGEDLYEAMMTLYEDERALPIFSEFGDGTPITTEMVRHIKETALQQAVRFPWQRGDLVIIDNMRIMHGRMPFEGDRKILVSMV